MDFEDLMAGLMSEDGLKGIISDKFLLNGMIRSLVDGDFARVDGTGQEAALVGLLLRDKSHDDHPAVMLIEPAIKDGDRGYQQYILTTNSQEVDLETYAEAAGTLDLVESNTIPALLDLIDDMFEDRIDLAEVRERLDQFSDQIG